MTSIKILHLSSEKTWRGGEQQIAYLMGELKSQGITTMACARAGSEFATRMKEQGHQIFELPFKSELDLYTAWKIKQIVIREKIDIVHMHSGHSHTLGVLSHVLGHSAKLVLSKRTDYPVKDNVLSRWKFNYPAIKRILCVSKKISDVVAPDLKDPQKLLVVYSGVDMAKFPKKPLKDIRQDLGLPKDARVVINTSAIAEQKDYATFVKVARELTLHHPDLYFVIFGDGPKKSEIESLVNEYRLTEKVRFTGFRKDLPQIIGSADLFLITSQDEGLGTSILDAFAVGLPVVATAAGGIPEIVRHGQTGLLAQVGDVKTLATHVENVLYSPSTLVDQLKNGAHQLVSEFSYKRTATQTLAIYQALPN